MVSYFVCDVAESGCTWLAASGGHNNYYCRGPIFCPTPLADLRSLEGCAEEIIIRHGYGLYGYPCTQLYVYGPSAIGCQWKPKQHHALSISSYPMTYNVSLSCVVMKV